MREDVPYAITAGLQNAVDGNPGRYNNPNMKNRGKTKAELIRELEGLRKKIARMERNQCVFEKAEKKLQTQLTEYEKLSALGRLTANVAHEIRNPITVIGGFAERLKKTLSAGTREKEYAELLGLEVKRLEAILRDVLLFSNRPFFLKEKQDINRIVIESLGVYAKASSRRSVTIERSLGNVTAVYVDKKHIREALRNLISNALDAMPEGGTLTVETDEKTINKKNYVAIKIADTGVGIPEENLHLIFEPFFTTKATREETGLGLSITRKIVEGHGGFMEVKSTVGKGSAFSLFFPYRAR
jgi:signal transduction histidine kinase